MASTTFVITEELRQQLRYYASFQQRSVALRQLVAFGAHPSPEVMLRSAQWLREELPVRLARRALELEDLPQGLSSIPAIQKVAGWYAQSFSELASLPDVKSYDPRKYQGRTTTAGAAASAIPPPPRSQSTSLNSAMQDLNRNFVQTIDKIKNRHDSVANLISKGVIQLRAQLVNEELSMDVHTFLDRFYLSRIGIRFLMGQHIAQFYNPPSPDYVGLVCTNTNINELVHEATQNALGVCQGYYDIFECPKVQVICNPHISFTYIPSHLHHILFELIKNSLRATVEFHGVNASKYPPIKIIVAEGHEDLTIKVSDEGGGIPRSAIPTIWLYSYSTAKPPPGDEDDERGGGGGGGGSIRVPLAGYGYGLPMSRLYARYFGGDLKIISMEGYGTDAYVHLNRLSDGLELLA